MNVTCPNCASVFRVDPSKIPEAGVRARCSICSAVFAVRREDGAQEQPAAAAAAPRSAAPAPSMAPAPPPPAPPQAAPRVEPVRPAAPAHPMPSGASAIPAPPAAPPRPASFPPPAVPMGSPRPAAPAGSPAGTGSPAAPPAPATRPAAAMPAAPPAPPSAPVHAVPAPPSSSPSGAARPAAGTGSRPVNPFLSQDPALKARRLARALISDMVVYHPTKRQDGLRDGTLKELFEEEIRKSWEEYAEQVGKDVADSTPYFKEALNEILAGGRQIF